MKLPVKVSRAATRDQEEAVDFYEEREAGLGEAFHTDVLTVLRNIASNPRQWPEVYKKIREAPVPNWPFSIYYRVQRTQIVVISVFHHARNPDVWKSRFTNGA